MMHDESIGESLLLSEIPRTEGKRIQTGPWDWVFGGGLYQTTTVLVGGTPGAGKTTLLLQWCSVMFGNPLYVAAEQSLLELALTCDRLKITKEIRFVNALSGANVAAVMKRHKPSIVMIDSLQGLAGEDDGMQIEICKTAKINAVYLNCPVLIVSHVTKDEMLAGKMTLQHEVDVTAMFYLDDEDQNIRILTTLKSRIGPAFYESYFQMEEHGLRHLGDRKPGNETK